MPAINFAASYRTLSIVATRLGGNLADLVLPRLCLACSVRLQRQQLGVCTACLNAIAVQRRQRCLRCALPIGSGMKLCAPCQLRPATLDRCYVMVDYLPPWDRIIQALKFHQQWSLGPPLGAALASTLAPALAPTLAKEVAIALDPVFATTIAPATTAVRWMLCPIPLSNQRLRERGFNQSQLLGKGIRAQLSRTNSVAPPLIDLLQRVRNTAPQTTLDWQQRQDNVRDAFALHDRKRAQSQGASIVLIDDVITTGATLNAAALALKQAGAAQVVGLAVARVL